MPAPQPLQITLRKAARVLEVSFDDGNVFSLPLEYLRTHSPSAEVQGHGGPMALVLGKENVGVTRVEPVGQYAVRLVFDDGHDSGLFTWKYLYELGVDQPGRWAAYLQRREAAQGPEKERPGTQARPKSSQDPPQVGLDHDPPVS